MARLETTSLTTCRGSRRVSPKVLAYLCVLGAATQPAKQRASFQAHAGKLQYAITAASTGASPEDIRFLWKEFPSLAKGLVRELIHQYLTGFYFLPGMEASVLSAGDPAAGYVVLLREVRHMSRDLAKAVNAGLDKYAYDHLQNGIPTSSACLVIRPDDLAMPVAALNSPYLEHFMQTFTLLYSRIGLPDPSSALLDDLLAQSK